MIGRNYAKAEIVVPAAKVQEVKIKSDKCKKDTPFLNKQEGVSYILRSVAI